MKPKLFVTIPSVHRELRYNTHTKEVHYEGVLYASIENKIYVKKFPRKPGLLIYWDQAIISYFHPKLFVAISPHYEATITYKKLMEVGKINTARIKYRGMMYNSLSDMEVIDNRPYHN